MRYNTSDNDKKPRDNQAKHEEKNIIREKNRKQENTNTPKKRIIFKFTKRTNRNSRLH